MLAQLRVLGIVALTGSALVLFGCGQKGALYLRPVATHAAPATPSASTIPSSDAKRPDTASVQ